MHSSSVPPGRVSAQSRVHRLHHPGTPSTSAATTVTPRSGRRANPTPPSPRSPQGVTVRLIEDAPSSTTVLPVNSMESTTVVGCRRPAPPPLSTAGARKAGRLPATRSTTAVVNDLRHIIAHLIDNDRAVGSVPRLLLDTYTAVLKERSEDPISFSNNAAGFDSSGFRANWFDELSGDDKATVELRATRHQIDVLNLEVKQLEQEHDDLRMARRAAQADLKAANRHAAEAKNSEMDVRGRMTEVGNTLAECIRDYNGERSRVARLQHQLQSAKQEEERRFNAKTADLRGQLEDTRDQLRLADEAMRHTERELASLRASFDEVDRVREELIDELDASIKAVEVRDGVVRDLQTKATARNTLLAKLQLDHDRLRLELGHARIGRRLFSLDRRWSTLACTAWIAHAWGGGTLLPVGSHGAKKGSASSLVTLTDASNNPPAHLRGGGGGGRGGGGKNKPMSTAALNMACFAALCALAHPRAEGCPADEYLLAHLSGLCRDDEKKAVALGTLLHDGAFEVRLAIAQAAGIQPPKLQKQQRSGNTERTTSSPSTTSPSATGRPSARGGGRKKSIAAGTTRPTTDGDEDGEVEWPPSATTLLRSRAPILELQTLGPCTWTLLFDAGLLDRSLQPTAFVRESLFDVYDAFLAACVEAERRLLRSAPPVDTASAVLATVSDTERFVIPPLRNVLPQHTTVSAMHSSATEGPEIRGADSKSGSPTGSASESAAQLQSLSRSVGEAESKAGPRHAAAAAAATYMDEENDTSSSVGGDSEGRRELLREAHEDRLQRRKQLIEGLNRLPRFLLPQQPVKSPTSTSAQPKGLAVPPPPDLVVSPSSPSSHHIFGRREVRSSSVTSNEVGPAGRSSPRATPASKPSAAPSTATPAISSSGGGEIAADRATIAPDPSSSLLYTLPSTEFWGVLRSFFSGPQPSGRAWRILPPHQLVRLRLLAAVDEQDGPEVHYRRLFEAQPPHGSPSCFLEGLTLAILQAAMAYRSAVETSLISAVRAMVGVAADEMPSPTSAGGTPTEPSPTVVRHTRAPSSGGDKPFSSAPLSPPSNPSTSPWALPLPEQAHQVDYREEGSNAAGGAVVSPPPSLLPAPVLTATPSTVRTPRIPVRALDDVAAAWATRWADLDEGRANIGTPVPSAPPTPSPTASPPTPSLSPRPNTNQPTIPGVPAKEIVGRTMRDVQRRLEERPSRGETVSIPFIMASLDAVCAAAKELPLRVANVRRIAPCGEADPSGAVPVDATDLALATVPVQPGSDHLGTAPSSAQQQHQLPPRAARPGRSSSTASRRSFAANLAAARARRASSISNTSLPALPPVGGGRSAASGGRGESTPTSPGVVPPPSVPLPPAVAWVVHPSGTEPVGVLPEDAEILSDYDVDATSIAPPPTTSQQQRPRRSLGAGVLSYSLTSPAGVTSASTSLNVSYVEGATASITGQPSAVASASDVLPGGPLQPAVPLQPPPPPPPPPPPAGAPQVLRAARILGESFARLHVPTFPSILVGPPHQTPFWELPYSTGPS